MKNLAIAVVSLLFCLAVSQVSALENTIDDSVSPAPTPAELKPEQAKSDQAKPQQVKRQKLVERQVENPVRILGD